MNWTILILDAAVIALSAGLVYTVIALERINKIVAKRLDRLEDAIWGIDD